MKLYVDTADRAAAESLLATGLFHGVTTNPTILQRASMGVADLRDIYRWAVEAGAQEVFFQAWGEDATTLIERGQQLRDLGREVVVKFVATRAGSTPAQPWLPAAYLLCLPRSMTRARQSSPRLPARPTSRHTWDG